ncbi:hypothetical protein [Secundilactobacillus collinoides]|uniref:Uncharacterized protein n=1 Tax=Secundilactobacillus collinoides TaxID=33960 RepID=A0A161VKK8_SECCO|nr:hypothetical protein [Secundilactobacillus collinoides]KZL42864.1 hypothetical protein TY91_02125 [Secundilactobacillus collinoides]
MTKKHYRLKTQRADGTPTFNVKIGRHLKQTNDKIAKDMFAVNDKIKNGVMSTYIKIENAFVDRFLEEVPDEKISHADFAGAQPTTVEHGK